MAITRAVGRSTLGELSTFELLLVVTMGDLVQQAVTQQDYSMTAGALAVGTFAFLVTALGWTQWRFPRARPILTGRPLLVMKDGAPDEKVLRQQRLSVADLLVDAREQGIRHTHDIEYAVLEADGRLSFFTRGQDEAGAPDPHPAGDNPQLPRTQRIAVSRAQPTTVKDAGRHTRRYSCVPDAPPGRGSR